MGVDPKRSTTNLESNCRLGMARPTRFVRMAFAFGGQVNHKRGILTVWLSVISCGKEIALSGQSIKADRNNSNDHHQRMSVSVVACPRNQTSSL
jgi:hypothetical protein